ncbi:MAG: hypothetical protein Sylvanvirus12_21 [Sylvanvirus sp.]|uniref:Uncharacterized protein n=1 Tax=Sylvanvirus sp. TaxID=2487774 RepID=A0A3G5ALN1_9VIRU|nr:MAG: hypothetical protein Sylvanvirus12_21 [Sylvanvirus sp.]
MSLPLQGYSKWTQDASWSLLLARSKDPLVNPIQGRLSDSIIETNHAFTYESIDNMTLEHLDVPFQRSFFSHRPAIDFTWGAYQIPKFCTVEWICDTPSSKETGHVRKQEYGQEQEQPPVEFVTTLHPSIWYSRIQSCKLNQYEFYVALIEVWQPDASSKVPAPSKSFFTANRSVFLYGCDVLEKSTSNSNVPMPWIYYESWDDVQLEYDIPELPTAFQQVVTKKPHSVLLIQCRDISRRRTPVFTVVPSMTLAKGTLPLPVDKESHPDTRQTKENQKGHEDHDPELVFIEDDDQNTSIFSTLAMPPSPWCLFREDSVFVSIPAPQHIHALNQWCSRLTWIQNTPQKSMISTSSTSDSPHVLEASLQWTETPLGLEVELHLTRTSSGGTYTYAQGKVRLKFASIYFDRIFYKVWKAFQLTRMDMGLNALNTSNTLNTNASFNTNAPVKDVWPMCEGGCQLPAQQWCVECMVYFCQRGCHSNAHRFDHMFDHTLITLPDTIPHLHSNRTETITTRAMSGMTIPFGGYDDEWKSNISMSSSHLQAKLVTHRCFDFEPQKPMKDAIAVSWRCHWHVQPLVHPDISYIDPLSTHRPIFSSLSATVSPSTVSYPIHANLITDTLNLELQTKMQFICPSWKEQFPYQFHIQPSTRRLCLEPTEETSWYKRIGRLPMCDMVPLTTDDVSESGLDEYMSSTYEETHAMMRLRFMKKFKFMPGQILMLLSVSPASPTVQPFSKQMVLVLRCIESGLNSTDLITTSNIALQSDLHSRLQQSLNASSVKTKLSLRFAVNTPILDQVCVQARDRGLQDRLGLDSSYTSFSSFSSITSSSGPSSMPASDTRWNNICTVAPIIDTPSKYIFVLHPAFVDEEVQLHRPVWAVAALNYRTQDVQILSKRCVLKPQEKKYLRDLLQKRCLTKFRLTLVDEHGRFIDTQQQEISAFLSCL